jgi:hypothetical protein
MNTDMSLSDEKIRRKVVILVLSYAEPPWSLIEVEGIRATWALNPHPDVEILFYYGGKSAIEGDRLFFDYPEGFSNIGYKTLAAFDYVNKHYDYDFVFRTNTSSYVDKINYLKFLEQFSPEENLYSGVKCVPPPNDPRPVFASGCGYTLSRKTLRLILEDRYSWNHTQIDDLALASLMRKHGIPVTDAPRYDFGDFSDLRTFSLADAEKQFHLRCKFQDSRSLDAERMARAHAVYKELRGGYTMETVNFLVRTSGRPNSFRRLLLSIQSQRLENRRIIVSVDTDDSERYVQSLVDVDTIVRVPHVEKEEDGHAPYNLYMNSLLDQVKEGWVVFVDDDNMFKESGVLSKFFGMVAGGDSKKLYVCRTYNAPGKVIIPSDKSFGKKVTLNDVDTSNLILHSSIAKKYRWDDRTGGDFRYADAVIQGEGEGCVEWVDLVVGLMPEGAHRGRNGDTLLPLAPCNVCSKEGHYLNMGFRTHARCPHCGSFERHRVLTHLLKSSKKSSCKKILHIAPESPIEYALKGIYPEAEYVSSSYPFKGNSTYSFDISHNIGLDTGSVDILICSHVLEHVPDYHSALAEIYRVLAPGGSAYLMFPIRRGTTVEDPNVKDPALRKALYGQEDHLRFFGLSSLGEIFKGYRVVRHDPFAFNDDLIYKVAFPTICDQVFEMVKG